MFMMADSLGPLLAPDGHLLCPHDYQVSLTSSYLTPATKGQDVIKITSEAYNKEFCSVPKHTPVSNLQKLCEIDTMLEDGIGGNLK